MNDAFRLMLDRVRWAFARPVFFVVGVTRWGTAWAQHALNAHPEIACHGESHLTDSLLPALGQALEGYNAQMAGLGKDLERAGYPRGDAGFRYAEMLFFARIALGTQFTRWSEGRAVKCLGERTAEHVMAMKELHELVPEAKFIHVTRDGRDEAISAWEFNRLTRGPDFTEKFPAFPPFAEVFAKNWNTGVGAGRQFARLHPGRVFEVRCENFMDRPTPTLSRLCRFLGVDWRDSVMTPCIEAGFAAAPLDVSLGHWRDHFDEKTLAAFRRQAGELLRLLGYDRPSAPKPAADEQLTF